MFRSLPGFFALSSMVLIGGCYTRPTTSDVTQIAERHQFRHKGECYSWLKSHRTGFTYCASPSFEVPYEAPLTAAKVEEPVDKTDVSREALVKRGKTVYEANCQVCHQASGQGQAGVFPPLAGAGSYYRDAQNHARIIVHGLNGEIVVNGTTYNGAMAPHGFLDDYDIAAVATYERNSWGNDDGDVLPEDVAAVR